VTEAYFNYTAQARDEWLTVENFFKTTHRVDRETKYMCEKGKEIFQT